MLATRNQQIKRKKPVCPTCNKKHAGECWKNNPKCFGCGELGHMRKNYPKEQKGVPAKLNAVNAGDAARDNLVQGMISIQGISALLLFDSGCTHSFISYSMVRKLNVKPRIFSPPLIVNTPSGEKTLVDKQVGPILLDVQGKSIVWEFAMYHLVGIDIILGMDWLSQNHAIIDCKKREVYLSLEDEKEGNQILFSWGRS